MLQGSCHCGAVNWRFEAVPEGATACNCTTCRRYAALWIYGHEDEDVFVTGPTTRYERGGKHLSFNFCPTCGCMVSWRGNHLEKDGRRRQAVNVRLCEPQTVADILIDHFDGLTSFDDLPRDGRKVGDYWF